MSRGLAGLTRSDFEELPPERTLALLPIGALEQHGPHGPLGTDAQIISELCRQAAELAGSDVVCLPTLPYGCSDHHLAVGPAASLREETLLRVLEDLAVSLVRSGFGGLFIMNGHGGNQAVVEIASRRASSSTGKPVAGGSYWAIAADAIESIAGHQTWRIPGHAGGFEMSILQALALDSEDRKLPSRRDPSISHGLPGITYTRTDYWRSLDGYSDDPSSADSRLGRDLVDAIAAEMALALDRFSRELGQS